MCWVRGMSKSECFAAHRTPHIAQPLATPQVLLQIAIRYPAEIKWLLIIPDGRHILWFLGYNLRGFFCFPLLFHSNPISGISLIILQCLIDLNKLEERCRHVTRRGGCDLGVHKR